MSLDLRPLAGFRWAAFMRTTFGPILALLLGVFLLIAGHGIQLTLIPLRAAVDAWTPFAIGVVGSAYFVGFVLGCLAAPHAIQRSGHIRAFAAFVALAAAITLAQFLWVAVVPWVVFRFGMGICLAGLYLVIESWLNDQATNATRGHIMSAYVVVSFTAITAGQFAVSLASPTEVLLFAAATILIVLATIPVVLTKAAQPAPLTLVRFRPKALYRSSPVGIVGVTMIGMTSGAFWSLAVVYALGVGMNTREAAVFTGLATVGGALAQWPVGRLSDFVDRRLVLIGLLLGAVLIGLLLALLPVAGGVRLLLGFLFGAMTLPTYAVAAAHAYDHAARENYVETAAGVLLATGIGSIAGPFVAAALIEGTRPEALFLFTAAAQGALALFVLARLWMRESPRPDEKTGFDLAATAPTGALIPPEAPNFAVAKPIMPDTSGVVPDKTGSDSPSKVDPLKHADQG